MRSFLVIQMCHQKEKSHSLLTSLHFFDLLVMPDSNSRSLAKDDWCTGCMEWCRDAWNSSGTSSHVPNRQLNHKTHINLQGIAPIFAGSLGFVLYMTNHAWSAAQSSCFVWINGQHRRQRNLSMVVVQCDQKLRWRGSIWRGYPRLFSWRLLFEVHGKYRQATTFHHYVIFFGPTYPFISVLRDITHTQR